MKTIVFGGAFDPPHLEHSRLIAYCLKALNAERLVIVPTYLPPHKSGGFLSFEHRVQLAKLAFGEVFDNVVIDTIEYDRAVEGYEHNYTSDVLPLLKAKYGDIIYLIGGDSLEHFETWHKPEDIVKVCPIAVVGRQGYDDVDDKIAHVKSRFGGEFIPVDFEGRAVASSTIKALLLLGKKPQDVAQNVYEYIITNHLADKYTPWIEQLKSYQSAPLYDHTENVVLRAVHLNSVHNLRQNYHKVFEGALLHDNAKERPSLDGLNIPTDSIGTPVMHQFLGAEKAQRDFGLADKDVLDAIRVHTTACKDMTTLQKLIYTADSTSYDRQYEPIPTLRKIGDEDFEDGFKAVLKYTYDKLVQKGNPIYPLTLEAVEYYLK
jgi:nicotinate-nucleotide adenylyltransferase